MPTEVAPDLDLAEIIEDDDLPSPTPKAPAPKVAVSPPPPPPPPPPAAKKHTHSARLVAEARRLGFTQNDLDENESAVIWEEVHNLTRLEAERPQPTPRPPAPTEQQPSVDPDDETLSEWEQVDPKGAAYLRRQRDEMKALKASLKERDEKLDAITKAEQQRQQQTFQGQVTAAFAPHKAALGTGDVAAARQAAVVSYLNHLAATKQHTTLEADVAKAVVALGFAAAPAPAAANVATPPPEEKPARRLPPKNPENGRFTKEDFAAGLVHRPDGGDAGNTDDLTDAELVRRRRREHGDPRGDRRTFVSDDDSDMPFTEER